MINLLNPMGGMMPGMSGNFAASNMMSPFSGPPAMQSPFGGQSLGSNGAEMMMYLLMQLLTQSMMAQMMDPNAMMSGMMPDFGQPGLSPGLGNFLGSPSAGSSGGGGYGGGSGSYGGAPTGGSPGSGSSSYGASSGGGSVAPSGVTSGNATPGAQAMMKRAASMLGMHESRDTAAISKITQKSGINPATTPWCAAFAMNMIDEHGLLDLDGLSNRNYCPTIENWAREKGVYGTPDKYKPKTGDAIMFDWNGDGTEDHIGLVESVKNGKVYTIEGNSSDSVKRNVYDLGDKRIDGYVVTKEAKGPAAGGKPTKTAPKTKTPPASAPPQDTKIT